MKLQSSEKEFCNAKSYQEAALTPLPEMIAPAWLEVRIFSAFHGSAQILPFPQSLS